MYMWNISSAASFRKNTKKKIWAHERKSTAYKFFVFFIRHHQRNVGAGLMQIYFCLPYISACQNLYIGMNCICALYLPHFRTIQFYVCSVLDSTLSSHQRILALHILVYICKNIIMRRRAIQTFFFFYLYGNFYLIFINSK